jgi:sulfopropanediol 3-dehydrogenase
MCCRPWAPPGYTGGLWVGKFLETRTYQRLTAEGTRAIAPAAAAISDAEQVAGHAITARMRLAREPVGS